VASGIYEIVNTSNGKRYVGQAINLSKRTYEHRRRLTIGCHPNTALQAAFHKYGAQSFEIRILEVVDVVGLTAEAAKLLLTDREQHHIERTPAGMGYQLAPSAGSTLGYRFSSDARMKMSAAKLRPEERARVSAQHKGKKVRPETLEKMRAANLGKFASEEDRRLISSGFTDESRKKIAESNARRVHSEETRAKLSAANKRQSRDTRSKAQMGRKHSPETRLKMSLARHALLERLRVESRN
jgi:group I intron endonuclease